MVGTVSSSNLPFDKHIAHLVRPLLAYFAKDPDSDGMDFGTSVKRYG